jgi:hypothetical protein
MIFFPRTLSLLVQLGLVHLLANNGDVTIICETVHYKVITWCCVSKYKI